MTAPDLLATSYVREEFDAAQQRRLRRHVTNLDSPVFALTELPQVTRAALFARYSRTSKSLRRLLLDEFLDAGEELTDGAPQAGSARAVALLGRVLAEYGDDSVAQLAGVHMACEQASQLLCKALEWGRLAAYLEQSTRYISYADRPGGRYRYHRDQELDASPLRGVYERAMDGLFDTYASLHEPLRAHLEAVLPREADAAARRQAIRALALDILRGLLPAGTVSNLGIFASPQTFEQLVLRLRAHPLPEARRYAELIAAELRTTIPEFVTRLDRPERGGAWVDYLRELREGLAAEARDLAVGAADTGTDSVALLEWDADGENRIIVAALFPHAECSAADLQRLMQVIGPEHRAQVFRAAVGERGNRRHRPGRGFEHALYTFEVVSDYGAFRDLQRHRLLTMQWQALSPALGYAVPAEVEAAGLGERWRAAVEVAEDAHAQLLGAFPEQAQYCVTLGHRLRYLMKLNAREALHMIELRTSPQGHASYRRICQDMHRLIDEQAGHHLVAAAMRFVGSDDVHLPRYAAEVVRPSA